MCSRNFNIYKNVVVVVILLVAVIVVAIVLILVIIETFLALRALSFLRPATSLSFQPVTIRGL